MVLDAGEQSQVMVNRSDVICDKRLIPAAGAFRCAGKVVQSTETWLSGAEGPEE